MISESDIPRECREILGTRTSTRIDNMVRDVLANTSLDQDQVQVAFSTKVSQAMTQLRDFLYESVYDISFVHADFVRSAKVIRELFEVFMSNDPIYLEEIGPLPQAAPNRARAVCDFVAGMTDRYALELYNKIFLPRPWGIY